MERHVEKYIHSLPDVDLLEYTRTKTHLPEALEFARIEMADRHFSPGHISELEEQLRQREQERQEAARQVAAEPLSLEWRIAVFLSGLYCAIPLVFFYPAWRKFHSIGAERKYKDTWFYALIGFCLQPLLVCLRIPPWSWFLAIF